MYKFITTDIEAYNSDANVQHQAVLKYFPYGEKVRFFMDEDKTIILSPELPKIDIKCSMALIPEYKIGEELKFKIRINAAVRDRVKKITVPLTKIGQLIPWFTKIANQGGFEIIQYIRVTPLGYLSCTHKDKSFKINAVEFQGFLRVIDSEKFYKAICGGMGRAKAFGLGVLNVS